MDSQLMETCEILDQPGLAVCADRRGEVLAAWCVAASLLLMLAAL